MSVTDESVGSVVARRFNENVATVHIDAVVNGRLTVQEFTGDTISSTDIGSKYLPAIIEFASADRALQYAIDKSGFKIKDFSDNTDFKTIASDYESKGREKLKDIGYRHSEFKRTL